MGTHMKQIAQVLFFSSVMFLASCSSTYNLSKNSVKKGKYLVRNGQFADKTWNETLAFDRTSWFHELTMQFDLWMAKVPPQSGFNFWFSKTELDDVQKCGDFRVTLVYSQDTKIFPNSLLREQLDFAGFRRIELIEFKKHLLNHPDSENNSTQLYQVFGICRDAKDAKPLVLNFPGYEEITLN